MKRCAFDKGDFCTILKCKECSFCTFKKTREELIKGRQRAMIRINGLPTPKRSYIIHTYHKQYLGGKND